MGALTQVVERIDAVLRLVGTCLRLAPHPLQFGSQQVAGFVDSRILGVDALGTLFKIIIVIATVAVDARLVEFQYFGAYLVEEIAVVRHHQYGHVAPGQVVLEPLYHVDVEVIGRLVEHQELWLIDQYLGQCHPFYLSTRELRHRLVDVVDFELRQNLLEAILIVPGSCVVHCLDCSGHQLIAAMLYGLLIVLHCNTPCIVARETGVDDRAAAVEGWHLFQVAHPQPVAKDYRAVILVGLTCNDAQQGRLPRAVFSN